MKTAHTKGPYIKASYDNYDEWGIPIYVRNDSGYYVTVAKVTFMGSADCEQGEANAEFLTRAANTHEAMVEALKDAERILDGPIADLLTGDSMSDTGAYDLLNIIRNAIALAEGKVKA